MREDSSPPSRDETEDRALAALEEQVPSTEGGSAGAASPPTPEGATPADGAVEEERGLGGRIPFARRLEDPQRVDGGGRWSVDSTRRRCHRCIEALHDHETFHTVLEPASAEQVGDADVSEIFVRRDYCVGCFSDDPPQTVFAHWTRVLPPPAGGARKIVNLASLLAHFHQLVETPALPDPLEEESAGGTAAPDGGAGTPVAPPEALEPHIPDLSPERLRLAYLLALFLVRRRMLKWEGIRDDLLQLRCKESARPVGLPVPPLSEAELEAAVAEFEELFR